MQISKTLLLELIWIGLYAGVAWFMSGSWEETALLSAGLVGGVVVLLADTLWLYRFYHSQTDAQSYQPLITRSVMFLAAFVLLSIFVVTSSGSLVGMGLVLGLGAGLLTEMLLFRSEPAAFQVVFLSDVKTRVGAQQVNRIVAGFAALQTFLTLSVVLGL